ncbi:MAG: UDP-N-acetylglucosamine 1-carboxyvinyltransferase [Clostridiales bacterium]|jgi:UDP-N-acetylglucosamine 1-carboxyvinyltransferase|nr:UDP-N-acetylglucosamine 1-carboxyvinyltransferase [Clostridiales bacterium]
MSVIKVAGGAPLHGELYVPGAKNAALPIMAASLLSKGPVRLAGCPRLSDVKNMITLMRALGCVIRWDDDVLEIDPRQAQFYELPEQLSKTLRSSIFLLGPMVARFKRAVATFPGGCDIGLRPIDLHVSALRALGVKIEEEHGVINCRGANLKGAHIYLDYPSVGATENAMMAALAAKGDTVIHNTAREPEIADLQLFLQKLGYTVRGAGSSAVHITGSKCAQTCEHRIIADRIVAGTYLCGAAMTGGDVTMRGIAPEQMGSVIGKLRECGCTVRQGDAYVRVRGPKRPGEIKRVETMPYPGFPTDMQAQFFALCSVAQGVSMIVENVFENRYRHAAELARMGGVSAVNGRIAVIRGVDRLMGASVTAWDLRGGAALVLAGLRAEGETTVCGVRHIDRGYACIEDDLKSLGAQICRAEG